MVLITLCSKNIKVDKCQKHAKNFAQFCTKILPSAVKNAWQQCFSVVRTTVQILGQEALSCGTFESFLASGSEIECMVHVAMLKLPKNYRGSLPNATFGSGKNRISQNSHQPNISQMRILDYLFHQCDFLAQNGLKLH